MRTQVDSGHGRRSGWSIQPVRLGLRNYIGQRGRELLLMRRINEINDSDRRQHASKKCMQTAARVSVMVCALTVVRMGNGTSTVCVVMLRECRIDNTARLRGGKRRRYDAGELSDHEEGCQHVDKTTYCPQPLHVHGMLRALSYAAFSAKF